MSIEHYFDSSKSWISNLLKSTSDLFQHEINKNEYNNRDISLCLRTSFIIFDHQIKLIWNLDDFDGIYDHEKAISMITEAKNNNENNRLSGTHIS